MKGVMTLLPPKKGVCQECSVDHRPEEPHNYNSLYYQTQFLMKHERAPTWEDAMSHCSDEMKVAWTEALEKHGVVI